MAKAGFNTDQEFYQHRDPVSGSTKTFMRTTHARQSSPRLEAHKRCVAEGMRGYKPSGATPAERARNQREHFTQVTKGCRGSGGRRAG